MTTTKKPEDLHPLLVAYEDEMVAIIRDRSNRRRFIEIVSMGQQALKLERLLSESRVESFKQEPVDDNGDNDEDGAVFHNGGIIMGQNLGDRIRGGEAQDMVRTMATLFQPLLDGQIRKARAEAGRELALALTELCKTRKVMAAQSLPTTEIDTRINQIREEIGNGSAVVPTLVLRGRETNKNGQKTDQSVVGEADAGRTDGS